MKACNQSGCREIALKGTSYCEAHTIERKRRPIANDSIYYSAKWKKIAHNHKSKYPICGYCKKAIAEVSDHYIELSDCATTVSPFDTSNLVSACHYCHNKKTRQVRAARAVNKAELQKWYIRNAPNDRALLAVHEWIRLDVN